MNFLYPTFLFTLFAILIPIIIHLFNFRTYKTLYFSNVRFLKDIKQETKSKSTLKHLLVLFMRIIAISALVFAFAQPYIPSGIEKKASIQNEIGIYIDNSFSTEADSKYGKISELAKKKALQITDAYPENTKFFFVTNDFEKKHQHLISKEQIKEFIQNTKTSPFIKSSTEIISKISDFLNSNNKKYNTKRAYIISDFQKNSSNINKLKNDSNLNIILIPLETENSNNLYIDSVWFETPARPLAQTDEIYVKITNKSEESYQEMPLKLFLNDTLKATSSYNIESEETIIEKLNFTNSNTGIINGKIEITDFPVSYDNTFFFNFDIKTELNILIISNKKKNKYIEDVFSNINDVTITYTPPKLTDYENIEKYELIIAEGLQYLTDKFIQASHSYISEGRTLIIFPAININIQSYNKFFNKLKLNYITGIDSSKIYAGRINYNAEIFKNVFKKKEQNLDLPYILKRVKFSSQTFTDEEVILFSEKNDKIISSANYKQGKVYVFAQAADISSGNLVLHPLWAPMIYNMAYYKNNKEKIYYTIGKDEIVEFINSSENKDKAVHIKNNKIDIIPQTFTADDYKTKLFLDNNIKDAGHYNILTENKTLKGISMNYDRTESDLKHYSANELNSIIEEKSLENYYVMNQKEELFSEIIKEQSIGKQLWNLFLILALFFLFAEILIIRIFK